MIRNRDGFQTSTQAHIINMNPAKAGFFLIASKRFAYIEKIASKQSRHIGKNGAGFSLAPKGIVCDPAHLGDFAHCAILLKICAIPLSWAIPLTCAIPLMLPFGYIQYIVYSEHKIQGKINQFFF